ncbi:MAG: LON peptidase substrate-binding domain-containing protein [Planctomycetia bacterium]|nr:LON peptidase substrate-binding domain-containing protein [Planctomycetia bacterium]
MSQIGDDLAFVPEQFSGRARLFPLPNLVLFPHVIQPLHVFEDRYVDLLHDALQDDRLIAMALLDTGWERDYEGRPPLAPVACLGRVLSCQAQPGTRYNLLLMGLRRVRIVRELETHKSFREAEVEVLEDEYSSALTETRPTVHRKLVTAFEKMLPCIADADELFNHLSMNSVSLGTLTDVISYALDLDVQCKQMLLAEKNVDKRTKMLLKHLKNAPISTRTAAGFPPAFSCN